MVPATEGSIVHSCSAAVCMDVNLDGFCWIFLGWCVVVLVGDLGGCLCVITCFIPTRWDHRTHELFHVFYLQSSNKFLFFAFCIFLVAPMQNHQIIRVFFSYFFRTVLLSCLSTRQVHNGGSRSSCGKRWDRCTISFAHGCVYCKHELVCNVIFWNLKRCFVLLPMFFWSDFNVIDLFQME